MVEIFNTLYWWDYFAIFLILFFGLPHGAFDVAVGISMGLYNNIKTKLIFLCSYSFLSILIIVLWYFFSQYILILFLLTSIFHFGLGDLKWDNKFSYYLSGYFNGGIIIFGISFLNFSEVNAIYNILVQGPTDLVWEFLKGGVIIWTLSCPIYFYINWKNLDKKYFIIFIILLAVIYFLPPLLAFAIYFCFIHSFNHVTRVIPALKISQTKESIYRLFFIFTFLSWFVGIFTLLFLVQSNSFSDSILRLTFIGLAALTFPHMILVDIFFRPKLKI